MTRQTLTAFLVATLFVVSGCENPEPLSPSSTHEPLLAATPADGNGNKLVFPFDFNLEVDCGSDTLDLHIVGWAQVREFGQPNNRNVELAVFHQTGTHTNSAGETFVFKEAGPDRVYFNQDGDLIIATIGRTSFGGVFGQVRINLTTGEVEFIAGNAFGSVNALACEALT